VTIRVVQGEREMATDNKQLGDFNLDGIPPAPRGTPQIEVTFDIDANGIVNVSAKDKGTGKEQQITIQASGGLSDEDIEKMVKDAEANAETDKKKRELVDAKNQADTMIHSSEKNLAEFGDKVTEDEKAAIEKDVQALKDVVGSEDLEKIKSALETLTQSSMKLGEAMYKEQQAATGATNPGSDGEQPKDENVVDADFEEVNEDTKQA
jgi:molecular chaperone DnaK